MGRGARCVQHPEGDSMDGKDQFFPMANVFHNPFMGFDYISNEKGLFQYMSAVVSSP